MFGQSYIFPIVILTDYMSNIILILKFINQFQVKDCVWSM